MVDGESAHGFGVQVAAQLSGLVAVIITALTP
jgi:hypothetical protein